MNDEIKITCENCGDSGVVTIDQENVDRVFCDECPIGQELQTLAKIHANAEIIEPESA